jgi:hypothetical protein
MANHYRGFGRGDYYFLDSVTIVVPTAIYLFSVLNARAVELTDR